MFETAKPNFDPPIDSKQTARVKIEKKNKRMSEGSGFNNEITVNSE